MRSEVKCLIPLLSQRISALYDSLQYSLSRAV